MTTEERDHERPRELLCLALYGELSAEERRELELHLPGCAPCRGFARELELGLGSLRREGPSLPAAPEPPLDWSAALLARARAEDARARAGEGRRALRLALSFAGGVAAGALAMALVQAGPAPTPDPDPIGTGRSTPPFELRASPPPPASGRGALAQLGAWGGWGGWGHWAAGPRSAR